MILLKKSNVSIVKNAKDWKEAIKLSVNPLEEQGYVSAEYKEAIINNVEAMGPYIVLAPNVALPHARPEQGAIKSQISITLFQESVYFNPQVSAKLFITMAAADNKSHLETLMKISELLQNEADVDSMLQAKDADALYCYFE